MITQTQLAVGSSNDVFKSKSEPRFEQFWIRDLGFSLKVRKLELLSALPAAERLLVAILRGDRDMACSSLSSRDHDFGAQLVKLVRANDFANLVLERIFELDLTQELSPLQDELRQPLLPHLTQMASLEVALSSSRERQFANILDILEQHSSDLLWVKGVHLSRTVYSKKQFRNHGDFDVIVRHKSIEAVLKTLQRAGFHCLPGSAYTNQLGAGPTDDHLDKFLVPSPDWIPVSALTMKNGLRPAPLDIKVGALDRGIQCREIDRIFDQAMEGICLGRKYFAPSLVDHLMISLRNLERDRFVGWKTLLDVSLLSASINRSDSWNVFMARCKIEGIQISAWMGLSLVAERLGTAIPSSVLEALAPSNSIILKYCVFTANPHFVWNVNSLPMLIWNALVSEDRMRKLSILARSLLPDRVFLSKYYLRGNRLTLMQHITCLMWHWLVLLLPAGIVRRSFGQILWHQSTDSNN